MTRIALLPLVALLAAAPALADPEPIRTENGGVLVISVSNDDGNVADFARLHLSQGDSGDGARRIAAN